MGPVEAAPALIRSPLTNPRSHTKRRPFVLRKSPLHSHHLKPGTSEGLRCTLPLSQRFDCSLCALKKIVKKKKKSQVSL